MQPSGGTAWPSHLDWTRHLHRVRRSSRLLWATVRVPHALCSQVDFSQQRTTGKPPGQLRAGHLTEGSLRTLGVVPYPANRATRNPPGIGTLRTATPGQRGDCRSLTDVRKSLCPVVEPDNIHDFATPDGQHLKPKGNSTTLPGILRTSHTHTDEKSITEDLHVIHAPPDASISTPLIPVQHLVAVLAAGIARRQALPKSRPDRAVR